jgi:hygromycin-B 7''-O-kinase
MPFPILDDAADDAAWDALRSDDAALAAGVAAICARHGLDGTRPVRYTSGSLPVYAIGTEHVLKLFPPQEGEFAEIEARALAVVDGALPIATPRLFAADTLNGWHCLLLTRLEGRRLVTAWPELALADRDRMADELGAALAALHAVDTRALADFTPHWEAFMQTQRDNAVERQRARQVEPLWLERLPEFLQRWMPPIEPRRVLLHTEVMREHLLVSPGRSGWRLTGLFHFEPSMLGAPEHEFAAVGLFVACNDSRFLRRILLAYGYRPDQLDAALQCRLMAYAMLHRFSNLRWYLERRPAQGATSFEQLAALWWPLA